MTSVLQLFLTLRNTVKPEQKLTEVWLEALERY